MRRRRRKPLVAAVEGFALGGGFELAMACDLVVAGRTATFGLPEVQRGVVATSGALFRAARLLPPNLARELLLLGGSIDAPRAYEIGFVNRVCEPGEALATALALAEQIAANAPVAVQATLAVVDGSLRGDDDDGWAATADAAATILASEDYHEGIAAFAEKRAPRWTGR